MKKAGLKITSITIGLFILLSLVLSFDMPAFAEKKTGEDKTVRVGWYESTFNQMDKFGRRSGYAYEYQQKLSVYTGWDYEYVGGSWPELLEMLKAGEIDMMSDVSYTDERAKEMLFPSYPMGAESYYIFITPENNEIKQGEYSTLNGKKIGVNKGSVPETMFVEWEEENGVEAEIVELTGTEQESLQMLISGQIDAYITQDSYGDINQYVPIIKIGQSEYYFAVNKDRPDLLEDLNYAMGRIQDEDRHYNQELFEKYSSSAGTNAFLMAEEKAWLEDHGAVRVGYIDDYLPFSDADDKTGELNGVLRDYLSVARDCIQNATIDFETVSYPNTEAALEGIASGEVDCVFPVNMTSYDSESRGLLATSPVMQAEIYACVRTRDRPAVQKDSDMKIATRAGLINDELFMQEKFPNWRAIPYDSLEECFKAVYEKEVDAAIISSYRVALTEELREKYNLSAQTTGESMEFSFAVNKKDIKLYTILSKTRNLVPVATIETSLADYSAPDHGITIWYILREHLLAVIMILLVIVALVVLFFVRRSRRMKRELEERLALQEEIISKEREKNEADEMINAMSTDYRSIFYVDLNKDTATCYRASTELKDGAKEGDSFSFSSRFSHYAKTYVDEEDREAFLEFIKPENIRRALEKEALISCRYLARWDGIEHYELLRMASVGPSGDASGGLIHAIGVGFSDVDSETRKELEKKAALLDALAQAEEASEAKTAFLSSMSHEIRTPMNAIIGLNRMALNKEDLPDDIRECLEKISISADHLLHLINNILDMSRIESGRLTISNVVFSFKDMLEQINTMITGQCQDKGLKFSCRVNGPVSNYYVGDDMKLKQVLLNILGNAVKYTPAGGEVFFDVEPLHEFDDKASLRFVIRDTGIGMDKDFLPKVFGAFSQEDENRSNKYGSTGLGMAITKSIVETMNGNIEVESEKGKGTTFTVTITLQTADVEGAPVALGEKQAADGGEVDLNGRHLLVAEDVEINLEIIKELLLSEGITIDHAENGQVAVDMFTAGEPGTYDAILMDIRMPVLDGLGATEAIRALDRDDAKSIPIIAMTANAFDEDVQRSLQAGLNAHLSKPIEPDNLFKTLRSMIR